MIKFWSCWPWECQKKNLVRLLVATWTRRNCVTLREGVRARLLWQRCTWDDTASAFEEKIKGIIQLWPTKTTKDGNKRLLCNLQWRVFRRKLVLEWQSSRWYSGPFRTLYTNRPDCPSSRLHHFGAVDCDTFLAFLSTVAAEDRNWWHHDNKQWDNNNRFFKLIWI